MHTLSTWRSSLKPPWNILTACNLLISWDLHALSPQKSSQFKFNFQNFVAQEFTFLFSINLTPFGGTINFPERHSPNKTRIFPLSDSLQTQIHFRFNLFYLANSCWIIFPIAIKQTRIFMRWLRSRNSLLVLCKIYR